MKRLSSFLALIIMMQIFTISSMAQYFMPSYQKLMYDEQLYMTVASTSYTYTDIGTITNGTTSKNCRGMQGINASSGYVSANGWVTGLSGTHVEVYIYGSTSTTNIYSSNNRKCNMSSDCSTVHSGTGTISTATSVFYVNDTCPSSISSHSRNSSYTSWGDRILY